MLTGSTNVLLPGWKHTLLLLVAMVTAIEKHSPDEIYRDVFTVSLV